MSPRLKKLIALVVLVPGLAAYVLGAMIVADGVPDVWFAQLAYFIVAGVAWAVPTGYLMIWAGRDPSRNGTEQGESPPETRS